MSPFESESQRKFLWMKHPEIAKRWARHTARKNRVKKGRHRSKRDTNDHDYRD